MKTNSLQFHSFFALLLLVGVTKGQKKSPGWLRRWRASFWTSCLMLLVTSVNVFGQTASKPFGSNTKYDYGTIQTIQTASQASQNAQSWYSYWSSNFVKSCGSDKAIVVYDYNGSNAYSEGQGYGMLLAAYFGDKATFDKLVQGYWSSRNSHGLMNWTISCSNPSVGANGATDGDLDAAMALLIANKQWPNTTSPHNYASYATTLINNIKANEFVNCNGMTVQKAGDYLGGCNCTNPSYYATGYYRAFAKHVPADASFWTKAADDGLDLLLKATHPTTGLNPAWTDQSGSITNGGTGDCNNIAAPGGGARTDFQFDAARTPWRIVIDYLWWGTPKAKQYLDKITTWANTKGIKNIMAGHHLDGTAYLTYTNSAFVGAFAVGAMGTTDQTVVNNFYKYWTDNSMTNQDWSSGKTLDDKPYFQNSLRTVYSFVASGNFWNPYAGGTTPQNQAPTVSISSPSNNASFTAPASITINANASDADGSISNVQFYNGSTLLGSDNSSPYSYTWTNVAAGTYTITVKATDNAGAVTTSSAITITVTAANQAPTVSITSPSNNASFTAPASITINANASDADGSISNVQFYNGSTLLGSDNSSPYSFTWTNVAAGTYTITAKATDNAGAVTTSSAITITVNAPVNQAPTVSITSPSNNASFTAPASITINANASDADGTISNVQFYNGSTLLGSDNSSPYSFTWTNVAAGTYTITAKATDNSGAVTTSSAITVTVSAPANQLPTVSITAPVTGATFTAPASVTITATASDPDGSITSVQFYNGSTLLGSDNSSPYSFTWTNVAAGGYSITAKATDNSGAVVTSAAVQITVTTPSNQLPTVSITAPITGATYTAPASVTISANASDPDGTITTVEFYNGSTLLGSDNSAPYSFSWTNVAAGTYSITAKATDNTGASVTSSEVQITVNTVSNQLPAVSITAPSNGATFTAPATITITATASDADGTVSGVQFYNGSTLLGSDNSAPYSFTWTNVAAGTYTITARATDNSGGVSTSAAVSITVNAANNQAPVVSITSPSTGATFTAPASITINATASDADGSISSVQFFSGSTLLGSDNTSPYSFSWTNVAAGTYTITAKATDNNGAVTTSSPVSVTVSEVTPTGVTIQAETACSVDGTLNETANAGFKGTGYVNTNDAVNASATWVVNSETAQTITLAIRYATATTPGRPMSLSVNGTTQVANIAFGNTGGVATWAVTNVEIALAAGSNTIKLVSLTDEGSPYIDELTYESTTVTAGTCPTIPTTTIQAETACSADGATNENLNAGFRGTGYVNTNDVVNASATWVFNSESAQTVKVDIRYATASTPGRPMSLSVNGTTQIANIAFDNTGGMTSWAVTSVNISLAAGSNTIKMVSLSDQGSPYIDEFTFASSTVTSGTCPSNPTPTTIQAETACAVDGTLNETANAGFRGTGYVNTNDAVNASATWVVNSEAAQTVNLDIRYATATTPGRPMSLSVNGTTQVANIAFNNTGGMTTWAVTSVQVNLAAGANTLKLVSLTDEGSPYIDELTFASSTVTAGTCTTNPGSGNCTVDAVPTAANWVVRNDWTDQYNGSGVSNSSDALQITHRQWGKNQLWVVQNNTPINVVSGQTYTVTFDFKNDATNPVSSIDVGFGTGVQWNGPTLAQPTVTAPSGYSSSSFTSKSVSITATTTGTVYLALRLNWPGQPNQKVTAYLKNLNVCDNAPVSAAAAAPVNYEVVPNPLEGSDNAMILIKDAETLPLTITITDLTGVTVYTSSSHYTNEGFYVGGNFKAGVYMVKVVYGQEVTTFRLIKN